MSRPNRIFLPFLVCIVAALSSGCTTYLKVDPMLPPTKPRPVVLGVACIDLRPENLLTLLTSAPDRERIQPAGEAMVELATSLLDEYGLTVHTDQDRLAILDDNAFGGLEQMSAEVSGYWFDRRAAAVYLSPESVDSEIEDLIHLFDTKVKNEAFVFVVATAREHQSTRVGPIAQQEIVIDVRVLVVDDLGRVLLDARAQEDGRGQLMVADFSAENVRLGLHKAFNEIRSLEREAL